MVGAVRRGSGEWRLGGGGGGRGSIKKEGMDTRKGEKEKKRRKTKTKKGRQEERNTDRQKEVKKERASKQESKQARSTLPPPTSVLYSVSVTTQFSMKGRCPWPKREGVHRDRGRSGDRSHPLPPPPPPSPSRALPIT